MANAERFGNGRRGLEAYLARETTFFNQTRGGKREEREASDAKRMERRLLDGWMRVGGQVTEFGSVGQNEERRG